MKKLDGFLEKNETNKNPYTVKFGLDNPSYANDLCRKMETISKSHPNIQFVFYHGETSDITEKVSSGDIDFGIVSNKTAENNLDALYVNLEASSLIIPDYNMTIEVLSDSFSEPYLVFRKDLSTVKKDISVVLSEVLEFKMH